MAAMMKMGMRLHRLASGCSTSYLGPGWDRGAVGQERSLGWSQRLAPHGKEVVGHAEQQVPPADPDEVEHVDGAQDELDGAEDVAVAPAGEVTVVERGAEHCSSKARPCSH